VVLLSAASSLPGPPCTCPLAIHFSPSASMKFVCSWVWI
jgi:hypothetical protein